MGATDRENDGVQSSVLAHPSSPTDAIRHRSLGSSWYPTGEGVVVTWRWVEKVWCVTQRVTQRGPVGCHAATWGHVTSVTSHPYRHWRQSRLLQSPHNVFLSYKIDLSENSEHFQDNIDNCLSRWMRVLLLLLFWLLTAIKLITSVSFSVNHPADVDRQLRRAHSETASILWTDVGAGTPDALF